MSSQTELELPSNLRGICSFSFRDNGLVVITTKGNITYLGACKIFDFLSENEPSLTIIVLDIQEARVMDNATITYLVKLQFHFGQKGKQFVVIGISEGIMVSMNKLGVSQTLAPYQTIEEIIEAYS